MSGYYIIPIPNDYLKLSGGTVSGGTLFSANLSANTFYLTNTPGNNNSSNYVLVYNNTTKAIEYRDASSIGVLGNFVPISGGTMTGQLNVPQISGNSITGFTYFSGSTPLQDVFVYSGSNIGAGTSQVFSQKNNNLLEFRTLSAGTNISISQTSDTITISSTLTGGTGGSSGSSGISGSSGTSGANGSSGSSGASGSSGTSGSSGNNGSSGTSGTSGTSGIANIFDGLNTYTATTVFSGVTATTINVSGLTIDNLIVSGNTNIWNLSSYTISANTFYSGTTPLQNIFPYSGTNIGSGSTGIFAQKNNDLLEFKTLSAGTKISITGSTDTVVIQTSGVNSYYIQDLAPSGTTYAPLYDGDRWFNTLMGIELVYIDDGNSSQWVEPVLSLTGGTSGNTNNLTKFTSPTTIGNTTIPIVEDGNGIIVGGTSIDPTAVFQINSTTRGFLPPRMNATQLNNIVNPAVGLIIYQTDGPVEGLYVFKSDNNWHLLG